jgi:hypothetical protein
MEPHNLYTIIALTAAMMSVVYMLFNLMLKFRQTRYDEEKMRIELEIMRRTLEDKVYRETERLTSNPQRWTDVNHLILESISKLDKKLEVRSERNNTKNRFLESAGIYELSRNIRNRDVFVLTPFHPKFEKTYELIASVCHKVGLKCSRGDEQFIRGGVLSHILKELTSASIVIANIDGRNPNVYYELGIAHALDKDVILISSSVNEVPFDLKSQRLIVWQNPDELAKELNATLTRLLIES